MKIARLAFAAIAASAAVAGCSGSGSDQFAPAQPADYSAMAWTDAFDAMVKKMSAEYAFTEWKGVDWNSLRDKYRGTVSAAEKASDKKTYYTALRAFAMEIPDGHVRLPADDQGLTDENIGGGYGLSLADLDDGTVIASALIKDGPAGKAGIYAGAKITAWNDAPISAAVSGQSTLWASRTIPTDYMKKLIQLGLLARGQVGSTAKVSYMNPGDTETKTASLTAVSDAYATLDGTGFITPPPAQDAAKMIEWKTLESGYGYIRLYYEITIENGQIVGGYPQVVYDRFKAAIKEMTDSNVQGIVLDLRGNHGGSDQLAADLCGFFTATKTFYESSEYYNAVTGKYVNILVDDVGNVVSGGKLYENPSSPTFSGPVAVLVDPVTISSGEGVAMGIGRLPQAKVIGFYGTNASFGMVGDSVTMPGGYTIGFPYGRSLDENGEIQLDSKNGQGGVQPTLRIPRTLENLLAKGEGKDIGIVYAFKWLDSVNGKKVD